MRSGNADSEQQGDWTIYKIIVTNGCGCTCSVDAVDSTGQGRGTIVEPNSNDKITCTHTPKGGCTGFQKGIEYTCHRPSGGGSSNTPSKPTNAGIPTNNSNNTPPKASDPGAKVNFDFAERINTKEGWQEYLRDYPDGPYSDIARQRLKQLLGNAQPEPKSKVTNQAGFHTVQLTSSGDGHTIVFAMSGSVMSVTESGSTIRCGLNQGITSSVGGGGPFGTFGCSYSLNGDTYSIKYSSRGHTRTGPPLYISSNSSYDANVSLSCQMAHAK